MSTTTLARLLAEKDRLQAEATALNEQLQRCDAALAAMDEAQKWRDELLAQHDWMASDAIIRGREIPLVDPQLNIAEIALRKASGEARAAALGRERIQEELATLNAQLTAVTAQFEETIWLSVPAAAYHLFTAAEAARKEYERALSALMSVPQYAFEEARHRTDHPAHHCYQLLSEMVRNERAELRTVPDSKAGKLLVDRVAEGRAQYGDITRWLPPNRGAPNGADHINREKAPEAPSAGGLPNPAVSASDVEMAAHAAAPTISAALEAT